MVNIQEITSESCKVIKIEMTGGHKFILHEGKNIEDTVAKVDFYKQYHFNNLNTPYSVIWIFRDFLLSARFLIEIIDLIKESEKKNLLRNAFVVMPHTATKIMAFEIIRGHLPRLELVNSVDAALRIISQRSNLTSADKKLHQSGYNR